MFTSYVVSSSMSEHHQNHIIQPPSSSSYDQSLNRFQTHHHHQHMITDAEKIDINPSGRSWNKEDKNDHQKKTLSSSSCPSTDDHNNTCNSSCSWDQTYDMSSVRVCADCHTTKTPLWRTGPTGPKSLCNACGLRRRKARENKVQKKPKLGVEKSCGGRKKIVLEDLAIRLSNNLSDQQVLFAQDDKEAAILLMALSYGTGLVRG